MADDDRHSPESPAAKKRRGTDEDLPAAEHDDRHPRSDPDALTAEMSGSGVATRPPLGLGRLVVLMGSQVGRKYIVEENAVIGRAPEVAVCLEDPMISRRHAQVIREEGGEFRIEDLGSRNKTIVNGNAIDSHKLSFGDRIQLGKHTVLLFTHVDPAEERILQRQKMEAIGRLGAGIAHDFNNLLGAVLASIDYLDSIDGARPLADSEIQDCVGDIRAAALRAAELTQRLLGFARRGAEAHGPVDLSDLCRETVDLSRRTFDRSVRIEHALGTGMRVNGSRAQLHQVLMNLFINARDAMLKGGLLKVEVRTASREELADLPLTTSTDHIVVTVADTGVGMDAAIQAHIFEPFFTTKSVEAGSGLGLATVWEVVTSHGGHVKVDSTPGEGTLFQVFLPSVTTSAAAAVSRQTVARDTPAGIRGVVLIVDDEAVVRRSLARLLTQAGHVVLQAADGREALEIYERAEKSPDVVLMDLDMPEVDGEACFDELLRLHPEVRVLFISGYRDEDRARRLLDRGAMGLLEKPCPAALLRQEIGRALVGR